MLFSVWLTACASQQARLVAGKQDFILGDYHRAFKQLQPLAVQQIPDAQYAVGYMYYYGLGTIQNNTLALKWLQSAAAQGQPQAQKALEMIGPELSTYPTPVNATFTAVPPNYEAEVAAAMAAQNQ